MAQASGETLSETSVSSLGYSDFVVSGAGAAGCTEYVFVKDLEIPAAEWNRQYTLLSLHALFEPVASRDTNISVFLNEDANAVAAIPATAFLNGWSRIEIPRGALEAENKLRACISTSNTTTRVTVFNDSRIGAYYKPDFSQETSFQVTASELSPKIGEEFRVYVTLRNYGSGDTNVHVRYRRGHLDAEMPEIEVVKGELEKSGLLKACTVRDGNGICTGPEELVFAYTAKAERAVIMTLLPAVVEYTNVFGEKITKESNRLVIEAVQPEIKIKAFLIAERQNYKTGETAGLRLAVKNDGRDALRNISGTLTASSGLDLMFGSYANGSAFGIAEILPGETAYFDFNAAAAAAGSYAVGCSIEYTDYNAEETLCEPIEVVYEAGGIGIMLVAALLLIAIAVIVYVYIQMR